MTARPYRESPPWRKALDLVEGVHHVTGAWPEEERHGGLADQARAKAVAVPANIIQAHEAETPAERSDRLSAANASRAAVETRLLIAQDLGHADERAITELLDLGADVGRLLRDQIVTTR